MAETVKLPGIGTVDKKYVYTGGALVAGFIGYYLWRQHNAAADPTSTTDTSATDTAGAADSSTSDFLTGTNGGFDFSGSAPVFSGAVQGGNFTTVQTNAPVTDADWNAKGVEILADRGVDSLAASHALSRYQSNLCVTDAEADYVRQAIAAIGDTPQTHHVISICPASAPPGTPSQPSGSALPAPGGLHSTGHTSTHVSLAWSPVTGAAYYRVYRNGATYNIGGTSTPNFTASGLRHSTTYHFHVRAIGFDGKTSPSSSSVSVKTSK